MKGTFAGQSITFLRLANPNDPGFGGGSGVVYALVRDAEGKKLVVPLHKLVLEVEADTTVLGGPASVVQTPPTKKG